jgi:hypothetical protein
VSDERDTLRPKPAPVRMPLAKLATKAPRVPFDAAPPSEREFQERARVTAVPPEPAPVSPKAEPEPVDVVPATERAKWAGVGRWLAPRVGALLVAAFGGGAVAPRITGDASRAVDNTDEIANLRAEIRSARTRIATLETEARSDRALDDKRHGYQLQLWRTRSNTKIRIPDGFPELPTLEMQVPLDGRLPAQVATPFPNE